MKLQRARLETIAYELAPIVVTSAELEERLAPAYDRLHLRVGQLEALTGIAERRWWEAGRLPSEGAARAARKAMARSRIPASEIGVVAYAGVCRDNFEPATACAVAAGLGLSPEVEIYDISNACLGVMNAIVAVANRIELGQIRAGLVVSAESSREIIETMIGEMNAEPTMDVFKLSIGTLTGGSGAVALVIADASLALDRPRLVGGVAQAAPEFHALCRWGEDRRNPPRARQFFELDAPAVQKNGVVLGLGTWQRFLAEMSWTPAAVDRVICHQVGAPHREVILRELGLTPAKDFSTFETLGNMGTVALPITAAIAWERGFLAPGQRVAFLGIGSGLNCLMLGWEW